ncbi:MAG: (Fe-S)-binding protein [Chitinophagaceae bacterium]
MKIKLFIPCFVDQLYPEIGIATYKLLKKLGLDVIYNEEQTCCGQPAYNAGFLDESASVCKKFMDDFDGEDYIVSPSGSCTGFIRSSAPELLQNGIYDTKVKRVSKKIYEISEFLVDILKINDVGASFYGKATYHDACGALRECGIKTAPRTLLKHVKGLELLEMKEAETCCGFGGTFAVKYEPISIGMAQTKINSALAAGADYIISTDISCLMHIDGHIKHSGHKLKTMHIAEILAEGL